MIQICLLSGWFFGLGVLSVLWYRSLPAHDLRLTGLITVCLGWAIGSGTAGVYSAAALMSGKRPADVGRYWNARSGWGWGVAGVALVFLSIETSTGLVLATRRHAGSDDGPAERVRTGLLASADLRGAELTRRPAGTLDYEPWLADYRAAYLARNPGADDGIDLTGKRDFVREAVARFNAALDAPDLSRADLRNADMRRAFLSGADLGDAAMQGTDLHRAQLQGANLYGARMQGAVLMAANLQGANLDGAGMQGAELRDAQLQGANLEGARLQGAKLEGANLQGANLARARTEGVNLGLANQRGTILSEAQIKEANIAQVWLAGVDLTWEEVRAGELRRAQMKGGDLRGVNLQGFDLRLAQMQGADLKGANLQGADLEGAILRGADLSEAQMQDANCSQASFGAALLSSAVVTCRAGTLEQRQLQWAVGDLSTVLPDGLTVVSCLESLSWEDERALAHHPEEGDFFRASRDQIRDALLCDSGEKPVRYPLPDSGVQ